MGGPGSGRKRAPKAIKILHGSFRAHRDNENEPEAPNDAPECPAYLSDIAKAEFAFIVQKLQQMRLMTSVDRPMIEIHAVAYGLWRDALDALAKNGAVEYVMNDNGGYQKVSPWMNIATAQAAVMTKCLTQLGFSPSARAGLSVERDHVNHCQVMRRTRG